MAESNSAEGAVDESNPQEITEPHENDVLCGRGGSINSWKGNERFRTLVERRKRIYLTARFKREKRLIASSIVTEIQALEPSGRFLSRNAKKGTWYVIDDEKARDKVSQALRENAPSIRAEIETEIHEQRAELQRTAQQQQPHPPPPPNAPPNSYYGGQPWGYFSYYGYAQQGPQPPGGVPPPAPAGYPHAHHHHPPPPGYYPPPPPHGGTLPSHPSGGSTSTSPCTCGNQHHHPQPFAPAPGHPHHPQTTNDAARASPPASSNGSNNSEPERVAAPTTEHVTTPLPPEREEQKQPRPEDDEKSVLDALSESMSAILSPSLASWNFSLGGAMSMHSVHKDEDEKLETATVASKPIKYVHQPEEDRSVASEGSKARSVHFKDERALSGQSLDNRRRKLPPRIMHSSQISYPRGPKMMRRGSNGTSIPRPPVAGGGSPAPVSSVNLSDNDGMSSMISLMTTEGMNSIMEDGPLVFGSYEHEMYRMQHPNGEFKQREDEPADTEPIPIDQKPKVKRSDSKNMSDEFSSSRLTAVANQIVMSMGSWDASTIARGTDNTRPQPEAIPKQVQQQQKVSETMAVEIEGQEVQLVDDDDDDDMMDTGGNSVVESRIPGDEKNRPKGEDWPSRVGNCHSWLPESLGNASFLSPSLGSNGNSPASSMDMDLSAGSTDPFSCAGSITGSIGGASLCRVFDAEAQSQIQNNVMSTNTPNVAGNRAVARMPSWERNMRSKSPLSLSSGDLDDHSLMNKVEECGRMLRRSSISTIGSADNNEQSFTKE